MGIFEADLPGSGTTETYIPPRLQGYEVRRLLGVGGSATVWLVANTTTGTERALKVMACPEASDEVSRFETRRELAILSRYGHVHLIGIHQVLDTDQGPALLMDYAAGGSLSQLVASRGPLPVGEVITLLTPIAQALAHLHGHGVTHGDVSPGNILFTSEGMPLLSDLGVGRLLGEVSGAGRHTPGFAPAGVTSGHLRGHLVHAQSMPASDVYALGAVGWFCLTGRVPATTINRPPLSVLVPGVPESLVFLIEAALSEEGGDRPEAGEFARLVHGCAQPQPVDLVQSVHPSVLPELRTRRSVQAESGQRRFRRSRTQRHSETQRHSGVQPHARAQRAGGSHRIAGARGRAGGGSVRQRPAWLVPSAVAAALAVVLTLAGITLGAGLFGGTPGPVVPDAPVEAPSRATKPASSAKPPAADVAELVGLTQIKDPAAAVPALAQLRAAAYRQGDAALLRHVNAGGSGAMLADQKRLAVLESSGNRMSGLAAEVGEAELQSGSSPEAAEVAVTVTTSGYIEKNARGKAVRIQGKGQTQELILVLENSALGWRISEVALP